MKNKALKNKKRIIISSVLFLIVLIVAVLGFAEFKGFGKIDKTVNIAIPKGATAYDVASILEEQGLIGSKTAYYLYARIVKPDYRYGIHQVSGKDYFNITESLCRDSNVAACTVTIPEGYEMKEIAHKLASEGLVSTENFYKAANPKEYDYWFLEGIPEREEALEGYLFPDTYTFGGYETAHEIIDVMLKNFDNRVTPEMRNRVSETGLTFDEIITLASIIEREAADYNEFKKVAGVFYNRINKVGEANGYLESCATVQYILKERKPVLSVKDTKIDSLYNTYMYPGLPAGPIASPGLHAINAALYPESTDYLYFVADGNGTHYFAKDYQTHINNTKKAGL